LAVSLCKTIGVYDCDAYAGCYTTYMVCFKAACPVGANATEDVVLNAVTECNTQLSTCTSDAVL
jgi:hypothetical protein